MNKLITTLVLIALFTAPFARAWTPVPGADRAVSQVSTGELASALDHISYLSDHVSALTDHLSALSDTTSTSVAEFRYVAADMRGMVSNLNDFVNMAKKDYTETHQTIMGILAQIGKWVGIAASLFYAFVSKGRVQDHVAAGLAMLSNKKPDATASPQ